MYARQHGQAYWQEIAGRSVAEVLADGMPMPNFHLVTGIENEPYTNMEVTGYRTGFCNGLLFPVDQNPRPFALEDGVGLAQQTSTTWKGAGSLFLRGKS